jgi:hypothetical protein
MTNEEFERIKKFILEQQALCALNMHEAVDRRSETERNVSRLEDLVSRMTVTTPGKINSLAEKTSALIEAQRKTEEALSALDKKIAGLIDRMNKRAKSQEHTDQ